MTTARLAQLITIRDEAEKNSRNSMNYSDSERNKWEEIYKDCIMEIKRFPSAYNVHWNLED